MAEVRGGVLVSCTDVTVLFCVFLLLFYLQWDVLCESILQEPEEAELDVRRRLASLAANWPPSMLLDEARFKIVDFIFYLILLLVLIIVTRAK